MLPAVLAVVMRVREIKKGGGEGGAKKGEKGAA